MEIIRGISVHKYSSDKYPIRQTPKWKKESKADALTVPMKAHIYYTLHQSFKNMCFPSRIHCFVSLCASTAHDFHSRQCRQLNSRIMVKVKHFESCHPDRRTAGSGIGANDPGIRNVLNDSRMTGLAQPLVTTFPGTVIGVISLRSDNKIPAKLHKIDRQWIPTARVKLVLFVAV